MDEPIQARFTWTADDLIEAQRWHQRRRMRPVVRGLLYAFVGFAELLGIAVAIAEPTLAVGWLMVALPLLVPAIYMLRPWLVRRHFARRPDRDLAITWSLAPDRLTVEHAHGRSEFLWAALDRVVCTPRGLMLYSNEAIFHWLPRKAFEPGGFARAANLARTHATKFIDLTGSLTECSACGYDLRGSPADSACPECGAKRD